MSLKAMPCVVVNLGCEMLYILDQRLKAQEVPSNKGCKVLEDVVKTMFDPGFFNDKLVVPQELYSVGSTRKVFDRLAHSSIMRLSESSMDKLFDLMMMGYKYQIMCCTALQDTLQVSMRHLECVRGLLADGDVRVQEMLSAAGGMLARSYALLTTGQLHQLRQTLLGFLQDKRVKVSLFLAEGIQAATGRVVLPGPFAPAVGTVTTYDMSGNVESCEKLDMPCLQMDSNEFFQHPAPLGENLYDKTREKVQPPPRKGEWAGAAAAATAAAAGATQQQPAQEASTAAAAAAGATDAQGTSSSSSYLRKTMSMEATRAGSVNAELDLLAALMKVGRPGASDNFKLNLFGDGAEDLETSGAEAEQAVTSLTFEAGPSKGLATALGDLGLGDVAEGEQDLLDLLDKAGE